MQEKSSFLTIGTSTFYNDPDELRAELARKFITAAVALGHTVVVVDASPNPTIREKLAALGAYVHVQKEKGMGAGRRQALHEAYLMESKMVGAKEAVVAWVEPEKYPLVPFLARMAASVKSGNDLVIPRRKSLRSYPKYQETSELRGNWEVGNYTGRPDLDLWFGPRIIGPKALEYFLRYNGQYSDKWDSIFIPVARALHDKLQVRSEVVDYVHPAEQTSIEDNDPAMDQKRDHQLQTLIFAMGMECQKLRLEW